MVSIPCFLCGNQIGKRRDKHGKPYFVCEPCGVQIFVRRRPGIQNLAALIKQLQMHDYHFREHTHMLCEIQAVLAEIRGVNREIKALEGEPGLFRSAKDKRDKKRTLELLELRVKNLFLELEQLARRGSDREA